MSENQTPMGDDAKILLTRNEDDHLEAYLADGVRRAHSLLGTSENAAGFVWLVRSAAAFHKIPVEEA